MPRARVNLKSMSEKAHTLQSSKPTLALAATPHGLLQRKCACGGSAGLNSECEECGRNRLTMQRSASNQAAPDTVPPIVHDVLRASGQPLDTNTRGLMEQHFGHDFSRVRVHTDARAAKSARLVNASAYTVGHNVVFETGQYQPGTTAGRQLLAHELTHVMQQAQNTTFAPLQIVPEADASETEARHHADSWSDATPLGPVSQATPTPVQLTRNGPAGGKPPFKITPADLDHLRSTMEQLMGKLDDKTRNTLTRNKTIVIGLVVDEDGDPTMVYTVSGNWTNKKLRAAADEVGVTRWEATPRAEGRGEVGAPGDAEQLMIEAADENNFEVSGMAVSRPACVDCQDALGEHEHGPIPIVEVKNPAQTAQQKPQAGANVPEEGEGEGEQEGATRVRIATGEEGAGEEGTPRMRIIAQEMEEDEVEVLPARRTMTMEGPGEMPPSPRTTIMGVTLTFAAGVATNLLTGAFRSKVESDLANMPHPKIDKRSAKGFLSDPSTADAARLIDMLDKDLLPFGRELRAKQEKVLAAAQLKLLAIGVSSLSAEDRLKYLTDMTDQFDDYEAQLATVEDNLDAILAKKDEALKTAKACDKLRAILNTVYMEQHWLETGFTIEEHEDVDSNLAHLAAVIRGAFGDAQKLQQQLEKLEQEEKSFRQSLNAVFKQEFDVVFEARLKEQQKRDAAKAAAAAKRPPTPPPAPRKSPPPAPVAPDLLPPPGTVAQPPAFSPLAAIQPWDNRVAGSADVASKFESEKSWFIATESKLRQLAHENKRGTPAYATLYQQFDAKRKAWPGQLAQSIALLTKENAGGYEQSITRLRALQDWLRNEGQSLLDQVMPPE